MRRKGCLHGEGGETGLALKVTGLQTAERSDAVCKSGSPHGWAFTPAFRFETPNIRWTWDGRILGLLPFSEERMGIWRWIHYCCLTNVRPIGMHLFRRLGNNPEEMLGQMIEEITLENKLIEII
jgi:hypothetical protein